MNKYLVINGVNKIFISLFFLVLVSACDNQQEAAKKDNALDKQVKVESQAENKTEENKTLDAQDIAQKYLLVDTHIDLPHRLEKKYEDVSVKTEYGDFDYSRAKQGGLNAAFMSIYIPSSLQEEGGSYEMANKLIDSVEAMVKQSPNKFALASSTKKIEDNFKKGLISLPLGMENGSAIEGDLKKLRHFYNRGIRYITLTHAKANHISDSSYDTERPAKGLTDFGKKLVVEMNRLGIMIDVSHISDEAFYQVMKISQVPVIASHSSARHFTPDFERNMSDRMIKLLAKKGGVIQINFGSTFISQKSIENSDAFKEALEQFIKENNYDEYGEEARQFKIDYRKKIPFEFASLNNVLDHFDHVIKLVGIDYVGIGSDYDGVGDSLPNGLKDVSAYPALIQGFIERGYSEQDIEKIMSGNLMRVWKKVEAYAN